MRFIADLHTHSHFSRATSPNLDLPTIYQWAVYKGIQVVGTGDFTHPTWFKHIQEMLEPAEPGLFQLKKSFQDKVKMPIYQNIPEVRFLLSVEVNNVYKKHNKERRIHNIIFAPDIETLKKVRESLAKFGDLTSDGRPILKLDCHDLLEVLLGVSPDCYLVPAHIWTPWFSIFGSNSGFDHIEECFGDLTKYIFALETGLSSDPAMNWRCSQLDRFVLISNSDAHSPGKLGREANIFNCDLSYFSMFQALKNADVKQFLGTIEFYAEEGKYHLDGHRKCNIRFSPEETQKNKGICPVCGKGITLGVMSRLNALADRKPGERPEKIFPFTSLIPLEMIVQEVLDSKEGSRKVKATYENLLTMVAPELQILSDMSIVELEKRTSPILAEAVRRVREGKIIVHPGYDGEFGSIQIFTPEERLEFQGNTNFLGWSPNILDRRDELEEIPNSDAATHSNTNPIRKSDAVGTNSVICESVPKHELPKIESNIPQDDVGNWKSLLDQYKKEANELANLRNKKLAVIRQLEQKISRCSMPSGLCSDKDENLAVAAPLQKTKKQSQSKQSKLEQLQSLSEQPSLEESEIKLAVPEQTCHPVCPDRQEQSSLEQSKVNLTVSEQVSTQASSPQEVQSSLKQRKIESVVLEKASTQVCPSKEKQSSLSDQVKTERSETKQPKKKKAKSEQTKQTEAEKAQLEQVDIAQTNLEKTKLLQDQPDPSKPVQQELEKNLSEPIKLDQETTSPSQPQIVQMQPEQMKSDRSAETKLERTHSRKSKSKPTESTMEQSKSELAQLKESKSVQSLSHSTQAKTEQLLSEKATPSHSTQAKSKGIPAENRNQTNLSQSNLKNPQGKESRQKKENNQPNTNSIKKEKASNSNVEMNGSKSILPEDLPYALEQKTIILHKNTPCLVSAGPGTGKTHVLAYRIAHSIIEKRFLPEQILVIVLNRRSVFEMKQYLSNLLGESAHFITVVTFSGLGLFILQKHHQVLGIPKDVRVVDSKQRQLLIQHIAPELGHFLPAISKKKHSESLSSTNNQLSSVELENAYREYQKLLSQQQVLDEEDLLNLPLRLFNKNPEIASLYQNYYPMIVVDEYQDITLAQYRLLRYFYTLKTDFMAIGDSDQAIFSFRGSDTRYFFQFASDFPKSITLKLTTNYRSTIPIVQAEIGIIRHNPTHRSSPIQSLQEGENVKFYQAKSGKSEAEFVAKTIIQLLEENYQYSNIAIFYRSFEHAQDMEEALNAMEIPYQIVGDGEYSPISNRVSMMDLYASKGHEFSIVFIIACEENILPCENCQSALEFEEERRLFYVGISRAKKRLYLSCAEKRLLAGKIQQNSCSRYIQEIPTQYLTKILPKNKAKKDSQDVEQISLF